MKRFLLLLLCSTLALGAFAQDTTSTTDKPKEKVAQTGSRDRRCKVV